MSDHASVLATHRSRRAGEGVLERARPGRLSAGLAGAGVLAQIAYPLLTGPALRTATILSVLLLAAAAVLHAGAAWGPGPGAVLLLVAGGLGLAAETVGVHTGFPFGHYSYSNGLGPRLAAVPLVVPLAWTMLAYPCLLLGRQLARWHRPGGWDPPGRAGAIGRAVVTALTGGLGLAAWDLFLDPQMVAQGNWSWSSPAPGLPGVPGVPLTNYAGWLLVSVVMIAALDRVLPAGSPIGESVPAAVLAWTWLGSAVGNLVFFDRPWVAVYGGLTMAVVTLPYLLVLRVRQLLRARQPAGGNPPTGESEPTMDRGTA